MKIAIFSDSHDNMPNIEKAIEYVKFKGISKLIHCGDVCAPAVMREIANLFDNEMHLVYGNVDGDRDKMEQLAKDLPNLKIHGEQGEVEIDGKKIGWVHYPNIAQEMAESGKYNAVFYGHDHKAWEKKVGDCMLRNPGTLAGLFAKPTFAIYDTENNNAELILIEKI